MNPTRVGTELPTFKRTWNRRKLTSMTASLIDTPGEWFVIRRYEGSKKNNAYAYAQHVREGRIKSLHPDLGFEVVARRDPDSTDIVNVYARHVPPSD